MLPKVIAAMLTAATLCSCAVSPVEPAGLPRTDLTPDIEAAAEKGVRDRLKDPDSAKFSDLVAYQKSPTAIAVCGYVNAKNSLGGYVGASPFLAYVGISKNANGETVYIAAGASLTNGTASDISAFYQVVPLCAPH